MTLGFDKICSMSRHGVHTWTKNACVCYVYKVCLHTHPVMCQESPDGMFLTPLEWCIKRSSALHKNRFT